MTEQIKWGAEIPVDGKRPEWLADDVMVRFIDPDGTVWNGAVKAGSTSVWPIIGAIRLPADHFAYTVFAWNEAHPDEQPFIPWGGGDDAPGDWDGGEALCEDPIGPFKPYNKFFWETDSKYFRKVIGYRKRAEPAQEAPAEGDDHVRLKKMTVTEAETWIHANSYYENRSQIIHALGALNIIRDETLLEMFEREVTGTSDTWLSGAKAAIEWMEKRA